MDKLFASIGLIACLGGLLHMGLGPVQRRRLSGWVWKARMGLRRRFKRRGPKPMDAAREAEALIARVSQARDHKKPPHKMH